MKISLNETQTSISDSRKFEIKINQKKWLGTVECIKLTVNRHCMQIRPFLSFSRNSREKSFFAVLRHFQELLSCFINCNWLTIITCLVYLHLRLWDLSFVSLMLQHASAWPAWLYKAKNVSFAHFHSLRFNFNFIANESSIRWNLQFNNKFTLHDSFFQQASEWNRRTRFIKWKSRWIEIRAWEMC